MTKNEISIQHFFDEYKNADLNDPAVRDYLLDYFVDKIFVYDDRIILTAWYGDEKKEITWGDIDCVVVKDRKRKKVRALRSWFHQAENHPGENRGDFSFDHRNTTDGVPKFFGRRAVTLLVTLFIGY